MNRASVILLSILTGRAAQRETLVPRPDGVSSRMCNLYVDYQKYINYSACYRNRPPCPRNPAPPSPPLTRGPVLVYCELVLHAAVFVQEKRRDAFPGDAMQSKPMISAIRILRLLGPILLGLQRVQVIPSNSVRHDGGAQIEVESNV